MTFNNVEFQTLTVAEQKQVDGGFVCGGLCIAGVVAGAFVAGAAVTAGAIALVDYFTDGDEENENSN